MNFVIIIPARYKSTRFPGKPLVDIAGKSMLKRTYEQCAKAVDEKLIYVATEDERIVEHCKENNMNVLLTSDECLTGTDRVAEFAKFVKADYYINVQGDEPLFNPEDIKKIIDSIEKYPNDILNGYCAIKTEKQYKSLSVPKVVFRPSGKLLYMSRSAIPGNKKGAFLKAWRQVCVYAFPFKALDEFYRVKNKTPLEDLEDIEILRFLELGMDVRMIELSDVSIAVDNPEDLTEVINKLTADAR
jgi:3-deoxy-manno-octulosonate cytidylyltransferase (CMP-KDO synthetase)